ncbi:MAG: serine/threonine-protein kinase PknK [Alphaproteobacteria bacterium]|nr:serine/threonine-protein kinase PknK [Alphaproteobacteria bacterium]
MYDRVYGCEVAQKVLRVDAATSVEDLKSEFRAVAGLVHPHLVTLYDLVVEGAGAYYTMEIVEGVRADRAGLAPERVEALVVDVLRALEVLHAGGLVHRDVKPSNVLVEPDGRAVLIDYGFVTTAGSDTGWSGTVAYMAPEVLAGAPPSAAGDVWALGVLAWELLAGEAFRPQWPGQPPPPPQAGSQALRSFVRRAVARDPASRPAVSDTLVGFGRAPMIPETPTDFIGREAEVSWVGEQLRSARMVVIEGPPGIGKSALLAEVLRGRAALGSRCHPSELVPYNGFDGAARGLAELGGEAVSGALRSAFPTLGPSDGIAEPGAVARGWAEALEAAGIEVLWIDDGQWIDRDSQHLLDAYLALERGPPVLMARRPHPPSGRPTLDLGPLAAGEADALARALGGLSDDVDGDPLRMKRAAERARTGVGELEAPGVPGASRLYRLLAVHGGPLELEPLGRAFGAPGFPRAVAWLVRDRRSLAHATPATVDFSHPTLREAVLESLPAEEARALHASLAEVLEASDPASSALHHVAAGALGAAVAPALVAARQAASVHAWSRAAHFLGLAVGGSPSAADPLRREHAHALAAAGSAREAAGVLVALGSTPDRIRATELLVGAGAFDDAEALLDGLLGEAGLRLPRWAPLSVARGLVWSARARQARPPEKPPEPDRIVDLLWTVTGAMGQYDAVRTFAFQGQHVARATQRGSPAQRSRALALEALYAEGTGDTARAAALDAEVDRLVADDDALAWVVASRGYRAFQEARFAEAISRFDEAEALFARSDRARWERHLGWTHRVFALGHLGRHREMREAYLARRKDFQRLDDRASLAMLELGAGALVALAADRPEEARARLATARRLSPDPLPTTFAFLELYGEVAIDRYEGVDAGPRVRAARWQLAPLRLFRLPASVLTYLRATTTLTRAPALLKAAERLEAVGTPLAAVQAAEIRARVGGPGRSSACAEGARRAGDAGLADAASTFRLMAAREADDAGAAEAALAELAARGIAAPERFARLYGA